MCVFVCACVCVWCQSVSGGLSRGGVIALMAWWKKLCRSLVVLDLRVQYFFPEGSRENRACPGCVGSMLMSLAIF